MNRRRVLIETSWNVKVYVVRYAPAHELVLIETSWNVKMGESINPDGTICINRNIVECKALQICDVPGVPVIVLIETSWNVKIVSQQIIGRWIPY